jgi:hypothetical protein
MERFEEEMENAKEQLVLPPASENEVSPLLRVMLWHEHLGPFLEDNRPETPSDSSSPSPSDHSSHISSATVYSRKKIDSLRSIISLPRPLQKRIPLRLVTFSYLSKVKKEFKKCEPRAKRLLMQYPPT